MKNTILPQEKAILLSRPQANSSTDSPTREAPDKSSRLWRPQSAPWVNDSQATSLEQTPPDISLDRREASNISYAYRPTPIDVDPQQQQRTFLPTLPPSINNTSTSESNRTTYTHQGLAPIKEDDMPYDLSGKFMMNPRAPVFVPGQPGMLPLQLKAVWDRV